MGLNLVKNKSNMYQFIDATWNTIKGKCYHDCSYCSIKGIAHRFNAPQKPVRFDEKELKTNLGKDNFIFVGSSCDMFAEDIPKEWIEKTLRKCKENPKNRYLFQTKNPHRLWEFNLPNKSVVCITLETNRFYEEIMRNSPNPAIRILGMRRIKLPKYITIEPIMNFDISTFINYIKSINPVQVNIGANTLLNIPLPEPPKEKILELISELEKFTKVNLKKNLNRLIK